MAEAYSPHQKKKSKSTLRPYLDMGKILKNTWAYYLVKMINSSALLSIVDMFQNTQ